MITTPISDCIPISGKQNNVKIGSSFWAEERNQTEFHNFHIFFAQNEVITTALFTCSLQVFTFNKTYKTISHSICENKEWYVFTATTVVILLLQLWTISLKIALHMKLYRDYTNLFCTGYHSLLQWHKVIDTECQLRYLSKGLYKEIKQT